MDTRFLFFFLLFILTGRVQLLIFSRLPGGHQSAASKQSTAMSTDSAGCLTSCGTPNKPTISILGINVIQDSTNHVTRRFIWLASLLTCLILAVVHGAGLIQRYRTYPTRVQLDVSNRQGIPLPAVTVCPVNRFNVKRLQLLWRETVLLASNDSNGHTIRPEPIEQYYQLADRMPIDQLWNRISYPDARSLFLMCYVGRGTECESAGQFQSIWTPSGTCFTYSSELNTLSGQFNGLYLRLGIDHPLDESIDSSGWKITIHERGVSPWLTSSRHYIEMWSDYTPSTKASDGGGTIKSQFMYTRLKPKEFRRVDHPRQPCHPENDGWSRADCEIDCFQRAVTSVTKCRLPYMLDLNDRTPFCNTSWSVRRTEELIGQLITETRSQLKCNCIEPCTKIVYMYQSESHTVEMDYGRIKIFYDTSLWVTVREVFVYSWVKLLCDAGNILCLLLGASVLSFFETADYVVGKLMTQLCPKRRPL